jgi:hypothetical protein
MLNLEGKMHVLTHIWVNLLEKPYIGKAWKGGGSRARVEAL